MSARLAIHNYSTHVKIVHDSGYEEVINKNYGKIIYNPGPPEAVFVESFGKKDALFTRKSQVKSITDHVLNTTPTVGATVKAIYDQINTFFFSVAGGDVDSPLEDITISDIAFTTSGTYNQHTQAGDETFTFSSVARGVRQSIFYVSNGTNTISFDSNVESELIGITNGGTLAAGGWWIHMWSSARDSTAPVRIQVNCPQVSPISVSAPTLSNFTVTTSTPNRIGFSSSKIVTTSTFAGFTILGHTVSSIHINPGQTTAHYLLLSDVVNEGESPTIAYDGTDNFQDADGTKLAAFTATAITNTVDNPDITAASVEEASPNDFVLTIDRNITATSFTGVTPKIDGTPATPNAISGTGTGTITITVDEEITSENTLTIDVDAETCTWVDGNGLGMQDITGQSVTNNVEAATPYDIAANAYVYYDVNNSAVADGVEVTTLNDETANNRDAVKAAPVTTGPNIAVRTINAQSIKTIECTEKNSLSMPFDGSGFAGASHEIWIGMELQDGNPSLNCGIFGAFNGNSREMLYIGSTTPFRTIIIIGNLTDGTFIDSGNTNYSDGVNTHFVLRIVIDYENDRIYVYKDGSDVTNLALDISGYTPANYDQSLNLILGAIDQAGTLVYGGAAGEARYITKFAILPTKLSAGDAASVLSQFTI